MNVDVDVDVADDNDVGCLSSPTVSRGSLLDPFLIFFDHNFASIVRKGYS